MTTFGIDVSHYQTGLSLSAARDSGKEFVVAKATEGANTRDSQFNAWRRQAVDQEMLFAAYHFLREDSSAEAQADNTAAVIGDSGIPVIIDCERSGTSSPSYGKVMNYADALRARGVRVSRLLYLPRWYWMEMGRPDVSDWAIWQSHYSTSSRAYPGDNSDRWVASGTFVPRVLQYTSQGSIPGYSGDIDFNAYRGNREDLVFTGWFLDYKKDEFDMATKAEIQQWVATTPIVVNTDTGEERPLQRVLRDLLTKVDAAKDFAKEDNYTGPTVDAIVDAVWAAADSAPRGGEITQEDVRKAVADVLTRGTETVPEV